MMELHQMKNFAESQSICGNCKEEKDKKCPCKLKEFLKSVSELCKNLIEEERSTECLD